MPSPKNPKKYQLYISHQRESHLGKTPWNKGLFITPKYWMERFNLKYKILSNGCWEWQGNIEKNGYGRFWCNGKNLLTHRFSYSFFNGEIPDKMTVDHICKNRRCVNPYHLDLVTRQENVIRGNNKIAKNSTKTHCPSGHEYLGENLQLTKKGYRHCRFCHNKRTRNYYARKRGELIS